MINYNKKTNNFIKNCIEFFVILIVVKQLNDISLRVNKLYTNNNKNEEYSWFLKIRASSKSIIFSLSWLIYSIK
jgi:hypothetical protein